MICEKRLLKILYCPHVSEKSSVTTEKYNTIVLKVSKNSNKSEIKTAVSKLFGAKVNNVRTLIVKGKQKRHKQRIYRHSNWKKAYITLKKGQKIDLISNIE